MRQCGFVRRVTLESVDWLEECHIRECGFVRRLSH